MNHTKLMEYVEFPMDNIQDLKRTLEFFVCEGALNKNWYDGERLRSERQKVVIDIVSDIMNDDIVKDANGNYISPNYTAHYVYEMKLC